MQNVNGRAWQYVKGLQALLASLWTGRERIRQDSVYWQRPGKSVPNRSHFTSHVRSLLLSVERSLLMSRSWHKEPDYVFGQRILTLRTSLGVTQEGLATLLRISRKSIVRWEAGERYPNASHLQALLTLALQHGAFAAGQEEEEIRAFWRAAHQKVLLDERWLQHLLSQPALPQSEGTGELPIDAGRHRAPATDSGPQVDWGEALDVPSFYGRTSELAVLSRWIGEDRCRVVSVLGMGVLASRRWPSW